MKFKLSSDQGSVTAELAVALPAVAMVLTITIAAFGLQIERLKLVSNAATIARAIARTESAESVNQLAAALAGSASLMLETKADLICARLTRGFSLPSLPGKTLELSEVQCARKLGL
ncbi:hypothetical protein [Rhodoluna sp.]|uniref:hypothetical protein n=1 Tax=Rhodoluna sp. TaxID=1969481 RepID=UPI0025CF5788|nr:hypothetical protein [Rhodoluna sp.]